MREDTRLSRDMEWMVCEKCGSLATAFIVDVGLRCGRCHVHAPEYRADPGEGGPLWEAGV